MHQNFTDYQGSNIIKVYSVFTVHQNFTGYQLSNSIKIYSVLTVRQNFTDDQGSNGIRSREFHQQKAVLVVPMIHHIHLTSFIVKALFTYCCLLKILYIRAS